MYFDNKSILVTGGTGSFGQAFVEYVFANYKPRKIIIFSRDEMKQWEMAKKYTDNAAVRFFIGDVRDRDRLYRACSDVDIVVHAAATKIVPIAESDPFECVKTNVIGAMNVIDASLDNSVEKVVALSTDKASSPVNLYGATKLASDKLFVASNVYGTDKTKFSVVRYGNVMGSRGSVLPFFIEKAKTGELPITDFQMTRFMITLEQGVKLVELAFNDMKGGEIYVKKLPSMKVVDMARAVAPEAKLIEVGIRPGEKIHEQMIGKEDAHFTYDYNDYFKIVPSTASPEELRQLTAAGKKVDLNFSYSSESNENWMTMAELKKFINNHHHKFLKI